MYYTCLILSFLFYHWINPVLERLERKVKDKYTESGKMVLFGKEITCNFIPKEKASKLSCCNKSLQNANKKIK